ncbi:MULTISPECIES: YegP family protein [Brucella]|uniref:YegP family protein n=1 Tax=Brucella TaxID=234 RepID=UPI00224B6DB5|nr:YegP family protein [Brucella intermedia]
MYKFEVYQDKAGEYRFRFRASNGEIMFSSEGYSAKASALKSIESLKKNVPAAAIEDQTTATV